VYRFASRADCDIRLHGQSVRLSSDSFAPLLRGDDRDVASYLRIEELEGRIVLGGETDSCRRSTASAARSLAWSISPSGAVEPNTVYVATPLCNTSSTTSRAPGKRPGIRSPGFGTAGTHRISDEWGVIKTRQTFGSGDTAYGIPLGDEECI
jgi:hypothetical protein